MPQPDPQCDPEHAAEPHAEDIAIDDVGQPQPGTPAHGEELSEGDFVDEDDLVTNLVVVEEVKKKGKKQKLEGPSWTMCVFPPEEEDSAEFPGGPKDTSVLTSYKTHFARYVYEGYLTSSGTFVSHGKKMKELAKIASDAQWFRDRVEATGLADLAKTGYEHLDPCSISAFAERWNADTSTFHMPAGEIKVTLDDVSYLLHLPISGCLLDHTPLSKDQGIEVLVNLLGAQPANAHSDVSRPKDATHGYMRWYFRISHPYTIPLPPGHPPRQCEAEAIIEEEGEAEGALATRLTTRINRLRQLARNLLDNGELSEGSRARRDVLEIWEAEHYAQQYARRTDDRGFANQ
ncbi:unnamed protein product [Trifolium pratense]|uniref:Uncharacterized protein n=1 Tax=Trifolium pratense TaxID=57577 RepID=A0ACB0L8V2_TRIPR|nr:unnamed protein product [Trifolium pratense]